MKLPIIILISLFLLLQYKLWFSSGSIIDVLHLKQKVIAQESENNLLKQRNAALAAEVQDLKLGQAAIEEHARSDLGMIKKGEIFYQISDN